VLALAEAEPHALASPLPLPAMPSPVSVSWQGPGYGNKAFTAREWDLETGLYYYRARYYEPRIARFISEDPIQLAAGMNFFSYVENNPVNRKDPFGLQSADLKNEWDVSGSKYVPVLPPTDCLGRCQYELGRCYGSMGPPAFAGGVLCRYVCKIGAPSFRLICSLICTVGATSTGQSEALSCYAQYRVCTGGCKQQPPSCGAR
jgi:RHS repeat-associated protein